LLIVATIAVLILFAGVVWLQPMPVLKWLARQQPDVLYFRTLQKRVVALTIDDAPHPDVTPRILDVLKRNEAHATFFVIGKHALGNAEILERCKREGHELGNHLMHEYPSILLSPERFAGELARVDELIGAPGAPKWFRPGSGWHNCRMLEQAKAEGYRCALGSVYPFDALIRSRATISKYIETQVFPGAVIIIHDGKPDRIRSAEVLEKVLPRLKASGYRVVSLSELVDFAEHGAS
jgi:peptidoglycan/xylan/chitin deacetylase (PgdA/CDA1 family)